MNNEHENNDSNFRRISDNIRCDKGYKLVINMKLSMMIINHNHRVISYKRTI